jgi:hypothetical protein
LPWWWGFSWFILGDGKTAVSHLSVLPLSKSDGARVPKATPEGRLSGNHKRLFGMH